MRSSAVVVLAVGAVLLTACGEPPAPPPQSSQPDSVTLTPAADGSQSVEIDADDGNRFHPSLVTARPGPVTVTVKHVGKGAPHNWSVPELPAARVSLLSAGRSKAVTFTVSKPGSYRFVCSIHVAQGQVGTLTVAAA